MFSRSRTCTTQLLQNNDESDVSYRIIGSHSNTEKVALNTGYEYLIGVPDIIWEICQVLWGERGGKTSLEGNNSSSICCATFSVL